MEYDLSAWYGEVEKVLAAQSPLAHSMQSLAAYCNKQFPWKNWDR